MGFGSAFTSAYNKAKESIQQSVAHIATTAKQALNKVNQLIKSPPPKSEAVARLNSCLNTPVKPAGVSSLKVFNALEKAKPKISAIKNSLPKKQSTKPASTPAKTVNACFNNVKKSFDTSVLFKNPAQSCPLIVKPPPVMTNPFAITPHEKECTYPSVMVPINYILSEMKSNASGTNVKIIKGGLSHWDSFELPEVKAGFVGGAYIYFAALVMPHSIWDHKGKILSDYGGKWTCDKPDQVNYSYDIWSNIHFGYVGLAAGFPEYALSSGAGFAQLLARTVPEGYLDRVKNSDYFSLLKLLDDPHDQEAIQIGFDLWKKYGLNVTAANILEAVRANQSKLETRICSLATLMSIASANSSIQMLQGGALGQLLQPAGLGVPPVIKPGQPSPTPTPATAPTTTQPGSTVRQMNQKGLDFLKGYEGLSLKTYNDIAGHPTIGYGHLIKKGDPYDSNSKITEAQAQELLQKDLESARKAVQNQVKVPLTDNQFAALTIFVFNLGSNILPGSDLLNYLNKGDFDNALKEMQKYNKITDPKTKQKVISKGLVNRRAAEAKLFLTP